MQLKADKKRVEVLLDDRDLNEILSGRAVTIAEISANDLRPLVVTRWLNPELKIINRANDLRGIEILTGVNPMEGLKNKGGTAITAPKPVEVNSRPFELEDKEDGTTKLGQTTPFSDARATTSPKIPRSGPAQFGRNLNAKGGREIQDILNRSKENRQKADNAETGLAGEDNERGEQK